jgi:hypothetical protein
VGGRDARASVAQGAPRGARRPGGDRDAATPRDPARQTRDPARPRSR